MRRRGGYLQREMVERIYRNMRPEYKAYARRSDFVDLPGLQRLANEYETLVQDSRSYQPPPDASRSLVPETAYKYKRNKDYRHEAAVLSAIDGKSVTSKEAAVQAGGTLNDKWGHQTYERSEGRPKFAWMNGEGTLKPGSSQQGNGSHRTYERNVERPRVSWMKDNPERNTNDRPRTTEDTNHRIRAPIVCWNCDATGHFARDCTRPRLLKCYYCKRPGIRTTDCCRNQGNAQRTLSRQGAQGPEVQNTSYPQGK